eukprot:8133088-Pyramimonas_sp.AAC.1
MQEVLAMVFRQAMDNANECQDKDEEHLKRLQAKRRRVDGTEGEGAGAPAEPSPAATPGQGESSAAGPTETQPANKPAPKMDIGARVATDSGKQAAGKSGL